MSDIDLLAGSNGSYGTAAARARQKENAENSNFTPQARAARIAELRRQFSNGTYQVDAEQLSAAIIKQSLSKNT